MKIEVDLYVGPSIGNGDPRRLVQAHYRGELLHTDRLDPFNAFARQQCGKAIMERLIRAEPSAKPSGMHNGGKAVYDQQCSRFADQILETAREADAAEAAREEKQARKRPAVKKIADLLSRDFPEPQHIVSGVLPQGVTLLCSVPKLGKTWLTMGLARAVEAGGLALGQIPVESGDVLLLALEDNDRRLKSRFDKILAGATVSSRLDYETQWPRFDEGGVEELERWLDEHDQARLIVIDTLAKVRPKPQRGRPLYNEDYATLEPLGTLAAKYGIGIIVVHHTRKAEAIDPFDRVSGTLGLNGAADTLMVLARARGQHDATLHITGRDLEEQELALRFDKEHCLWSILGNAEEFRLSEEHRGIIDSLQAAGEPMRPIDVARALGKAEEPHRTRIRQEMRRLGKAQKIKAVRGGRYTAVTPVTVVTAAHESPSLACDNCDRCDTQFPHTHEEEDAECVE